MSKQNFDKFINVKVKGAKKKEQLKQEKKAIKKEREAFFIEKKRELRAAKKLQSEAQTMSGQYPDKSTPDNMAINPKKGKPSGKVSKPFSQANATPAEASPNSKPTRENKKQFSADKTVPTSSHKATDARQQRNISVKTDRSSKPDHDAQKQVPLSEKPVAKIKPVKKTYDAGLPYERKPITKQVTLPDPSKKKPAAKKKPADPIAVPAISKPTKEIKAGIPKQAIPDEATSMPLNKYIAHGGICSRRDAGELVKSGRVQVNGQQVTDPGYKVKEGDVITANGKKVIPQHNLVYILLNKPKDFITTVDDPQGRKTVLDIVKSATNERIYPVGRLDRNTSGVLLLTNDGELAQHLTHPSFEVRKIYEAKLNKPLSKADFDKLIEGVELEDGKVNADSLAYADNKDKSIIGIEIHSGRNRVVRRMFEHLGYDVKGLDRVMFANLTKKNVERGKWRFLNEKEVRLLKFFNKRKQ